MKLLDQIKKDALSARKNREASKALSLGTLVGEIQTKEKSFSPAREITDAEVIAIVRKFAENAAETVRLLSNLSEARPDSLETAKAEQILFASYLPSQMSDSDIEAFVKANLAMGSIGALMGALKKNFPGQYDGTVASIIIRRELGQTNV